MSHLQIAELLGAYALDAVENDERDAVEWHLRECRACQLEVAEHRDTISFLGPSSLRAPDGLWDRIAGSLEENPPPLEMPPVVPLAAERARRGEGRSSRWMVGVGAAAAAVIAIIGLLSYRVVDEGRRIDRMEAEAPAGRLDAAISAARADPSVRQVEMRSGDGRLAAEAFVLADGTGYLVPTDLPAIGPERTYQLWAVVGPSKISVGVLGPAPGKAAFKAAGDVSALAITEEPAGGVIVSDRDPVGVGVLS
jgi:hypothetical protein